MEPITINIEVSQPISSTRLEKFVYVDCFDENEGLDLFSERENKYQTSKTESTKVSFPKEPTKLGIYIEKEIVHNYVKYEDIRNKYDLEFAKKGQYLTINDLSKKKIDITIKKISNIEYNDILVEFSPNNSIRFNLKFPDNISYFINLSLVNEFDSVLVSRMENRKIGSSLLSTLNNFDKAFK